jgi:hypothetical protein
MLSRDRSYATDFPAGTHMFYSNDAVVAIAEHLQPLLNQVDAETCTFEDRLVKRFALFFLRASIFALTPSFCG